MHIEMVSLNPSGPVGPDYVKVANNFAQTREYTFLALHPFESNVSLYFQVIVVVFIMITYYFRIFSSLLCLHVVFLTLHFLIISLIYDHRRDDEDLITSNR